MRRPRSAATRARRARTWAWIRLLAGATVLAILVWRLGTGPFLAGLRSVNAGSLAVAAGIAALTTMCCAWRWVLVSRGLGADLSMRVAIAGYYRAQLLNVALPGGVLGDVHRAVRRGREIGDLGRGARSVVWERVAGQAVQLILTAMVLLVLVSPVHAAMPWIVLAVGVAGVVGFLAVTIPSVREARWVRVMVSDTRSLVRPPRRGVGVAAMSLLVMIGQVATFVLAARTAGITASLGQLVPLAILVLAAMSLPLTIGGWGPRDGVAAWAFAAAGLGAAQGLSASVVYGVMAIVSSAPGAIVLIVDRSHRFTRPDRPARQEPPRPSVPVGAGEVAGG